MAHVLSPTSSKLDKNDQEEAGDKNDQPDAGDKASFHSDASSPSIMDMVEASRKSVEAAGERAKQRWRRIAMTIGSEQMIKFKRRAMEMTPMGRDVYLCELALGCPLAPNPEAQRSTFSAALATGNDSVVTFSTDVHRAWNKQNYGPVEHTARAYVQSGLRWSHVGRAPPRNGRRLVNTRLAQVLADKATVDSFASVVHLSVEERDELCRPACNWRAHGLKWAQTMVRPTGGDQLMHARLAQHLLDNCHHGTVTLARDKWESFAVDELHCGCFLEAADGSFFLPRGLFLEAPDGTFFLPPHAFRLLSVDFLEAASGNVFMPTDEESQPLTHRVGHHTGGLDLRCVDLSAASVNQRLQMLRRLDASLHLRQANLADARLQGGQFSFLDLRGANFRQAK